MKLSVIVCTYNRPSLLSETIDCLLDQSLSTEQYEIIIVYNSDVPRTGRVVDEYDEIHSLVRSIPEDQAGAGDAQGLAHARNLGVEAARSEYVLFLDDDIVGSFDLLETVYDTFQSVDPEPVCIGGRVLPNLEVEQPGWLPPSLPGLPVCDLGADPHWIEFPNEYVIGANLAFQRDFLRKEGGFPTELGRQQGTLLGNEEYELVRAAAEQSGVYYQPSATVEHFIGKERLVFSYFIRRFFWQGVSDCRSAHLEEETSSSLFGDSARKVIWQSGSVLKHLLSAIFTLDNQHRAGEIFQMIHRVGYLSEEIKITAHGDEHHEWFQS